MAGWNCTPLKAPLVPKTRLVPLPENTRRIDLGFPLRRTLTLTNVF
jgi:hypothetical protein